MLIAFVDFDGSWQFVHKLTAKEIEVLSERLLVVYIQQLVLLHDEEVLRKLDFPKNLFARISEVVKRNHYLRVFVDS